MMANEIHNMTYKLPVGQTAPWIDIESPIVRVLHDGDIVREWDTRGNTIVCFYEDIDYLDIPFDRLDGMRNVVKHFSPKYWIQSRSWG